MGQEIFSEKEIGALLRRATELQDADPTSGGAGLSITDIEQIARETGIDPMYVRAALAERAASAPSAGKFHLLGAPIFVESERIIDGTLTEEAWAAIVSEASRTFRVGGKIEEAGATRAWRYGERKTTHVNVVASPIRGKTKIRVTQSFGTTAFLSYYIPTIITFMASGIMLGESGGGAGLAAMAVAALLTVLSVVRIGFGRHVTRREQMQNDMLDRIEGQVSTETPAQLPATERQDRIELPDEPVSDTAETPARKRVR